MVEKIDPIREKYYKPLENAEICERYLYYLSALFSFIPLLIKENDYPDLLRLSQIVFPIFVISLTLTSVIIHLYLAPRAQEKRYKDFISHAFNVPHYEKTKGYYNNNQTKPIKRIAAQTLENSFYSKNIIGSMVNSERIKVVIYLMTWVAFLVNRNTDPTIIVIITQIIFSELFLAKWLKMELLKINFEKVFDKIFNLFKTKQNNKSFNTTTIETTCFYEIAKAHGTTTLSERIFNKKREKLDKEWAKLRKEISL